MFKNKIMLFKKTTLFVFTLFCWYLGSAQITLTAETNAPPAGYSDTIYVTTSSSMLIPEPGMDMTWDYSNLDTASSFVVEIEDVTGNTLFPEGYVAFPGTISFQSFSTNSVAYRYANAEGIFDVGYVVDQASFPLTALTGNPDDTFTFLADTITREEPLLNFQFPLTYPNTFSSTEIVERKIALTVASFGLTEAPVTAKRYVNVETEVTGYGQLIIPQRDMSPSPPIDVILTQSNTTLTDSFFLAGNPAPPALMAAFGVSQGQMGSRTSYEFFTAGLSAAVFDLAVIGSGDMADAFFRPRAVDLTTSTRTLTPAEFALSPNPVRRGQNFTLQSDQYLSQGYLKLLSTAGRVIQTFPLSGNGGSTYTLSLPKQLKPGLYFLQAFDQQGRIYQAERLIVH